MIELPEAIVKDGEIRCPICNRKHGELYGDELVENLSIFCKGRKGDKHKFVLNIRRENK